MNPLQQREVIDFGDVNDNGNSRFGDAKTERQSMKRDESESIGGRDVDDESFNLLSCELTDATPFQVGCLKNQKDEGTEIKNIDSVGKSEEGILIDRQLVQQTKYIRCAYHHHQQQQPMPQHPLNIRQPLVNQGQEGGTDGESAISPSGESDLSSLLFSSFEFPHEFSSIEATGWMDTLKNNSIEEEPVYIVMPYRDIPIIHNPLYDDGPVLPPIPKPSVSVPTTEDDEVSSKHHFFSRQNAIWMHNKLAYACYLL